MTRAHKIRLYPNNKQATTLNKTMGCSRAMYNWALAEVKNDNPWIKPEEGKEKQEKQPFVYNKYEMQNKMTVHKNTISYMQEITSTAVVNCPNDNLDDGIKRWKKKLNCFPKFHKKSHGGSFRIDGSLVKIDESLQKVKLPKPRHAKERRESFYWIRMAVPIRFAYTKINNVTISRKAGMYFCSFNLEVEGIPALCKNDTSEVGIDLGRGADNLMVCSDGKVFPSMGLLKKDEASQRIRNKRRSRRWVKGKETSKNWWKANKVAQKQEWRVAEVRKKYTHWLTNSVCKKYSVVCMEDLDVAAMMKSKRGAKQQADANFGEIKRQIMYKAGAVKFVPRFEASTNRCSVCGVTKLEEEKAGIGKRLKMWERTFKCNSCGHTEDRDLNASKCVRKYAVVQNKEIKKIGKKYVTRKPKLEVIGDKQENDTVSLTATNS